MSTFEAGPGQHLRIQEEITPTALSAKDILVRARNDASKTATFVILTRKRINPSLKST